MKKQLISITCTTLLCMGFTLTVMAQSVPNGVISQEGKTTIVNTESLTRNINAFKGPTPVKIYIEKNKVIKIETLRNRETPRFFHKAKAVLSAFLGKKVKQAINMEVDAVSGATYSSKGLIKNVKAGLEYYQKNK